MLRTIRSRIPYPFGVIAFWVSVLVKWFGLLRGGWSQRVVEYPWVLRQLRAFAPKGARVLDVGCSESVLSHVLLYMGYEVWGLDINDYPYKPRYMVFVKRDARNTGLPSNFFDAIVVVSTIEHIGLPVYGQVGFDVDGDVETIEELRRILKPGGYLIITTPFAGREFRIVPGERQYDIERLILLERGFEVVAEEFFLSYRLGRRVVWVGVNKDLDRKVLTNPEAPSLACFILKKA
jgi:SAM-dependent methyltransferase